MNALHLCNGNPNKEYNDIVPTNVRFDERVQSPTFNVLSYLEQQ